MTRPIPNYRGLHSAEALGLTDVEVISAREAAYNDSYPMANSLKAFEKYLVPAPLAHKTSLEAYSNCPAEAFLAGVCDAHDAFANCLKKFTKKQDGSYNKDSEDSLRQISLALIGGC